jgi:acid phosphatase
MGIYKAPGVLVYTVAGSSLNTYLTLSPGTYNAVVQEWDKCGSTKTPVTITVSGGSSSTGTIPSSSHVFVVVEENHSYSQVIGSSSMPYLNSLANKYGLSTQYYANTHPSIGNYFMMTAGQTITNNDSYCSTLTNDNIVRHLLSAGKTWKSYAESLPSAGYTGCGSGLYAKKHNPLAFFSDVANSSEKYNLVPFTQFSKDLANNNLPNFSFIVPNLMNDAHDGSLSAADNWLKTNIAPLISSATFQKDGILIIVFDESLDTDTAHGGGHIACLVIGPKVKLGMKSGTLYQHQNLLKTVMKALGLSSFPGAASGATPMTGLF